MSVAAQEDQPGNDKRSEKGDLLVLSEGDGIAAYSMICAWVKAGGDDQNVLKCPCHSEFNPRYTAQVVFGPAPRRFAALPLTVAYDWHIVAVTFVGKVGAQQSGDARSQRIPVLRTIAPTTIGG